MQQQYYYNVDHKRISVDFYNKDVWKLFEVGSYKKGTLIFNEYTKSIYLVSRDFDKDYVKDLQEFLTYAPQFGGVGKIDDIKITQELNADGKAVSVITIMRPGQEPERHEILGGNGGATGNGIWKPTVSEKGELSWELSVSEEPIPPVNIKGPRGAGIPIMTQDSYNAAVASGDLNEGDEFIMIPSVLDENGNSVPKTYGPTAAPEDVITSEITYAHGTYVDILFNALRAIQNEIAKIKNTFEYGINSYNDENTVMSEVMDGYNDLEEDEPLWAIEEDSLSEQLELNTNLEADNWFEKSSDDSVIDVTMPKVISFIGESQWKDLSGQLVLKTSSDSKIVTYFTTTGRNIKIDLEDISDSNNRMTVDFSALEVPDVERYNILLIVSRKQETKDADQETVYKGYNYVYGSISNFVTGELLKEGYFIFNEDGTISITDTESEAELDARYTIDSISCSDLTLSKFNIYTKYDSFSREVIPSIPNDDSYKYKASHITIRSVKDETVLNAVKDYLQENELVWDQYNKILRIKTNGTLQKVGGNSGFGGEGISEEEMLAALKAIGIISVVEEDGTKSLILENVGSITFKHPDTGDQYKVYVDSEGNLVTNKVTDPGNTIEKILESLGSNKIEFKDNVTNYRGFSADYFRRVSKVTTDLKNCPNDNASYGTYADRVRFSSMYAPLTTDPAFGCTHSFIEIENTSDLDFPLDGCYLHFYDPMADNKNGMVYHLALDGVLKSGSTYLVRGARHAEMDDESAVIKINTFDKEWYRPDGTLVSFAVNPEAALKKNAGGSTGEAYRICLTYGLPDLAATDILVTNNDGSVLSASDFPILVKNNRYIDCWNYSNDTNVSKNATSCIQNGWTWLQKGQIVIAKNSMVRLTFALDPAKQAFNGFSKKECSRTKYDSANDIQIVNLDNDFIGFPHSEETVGIDRYTPKASYEDRNVMTDKSQVNREKPNMVTCSFGIDVYNTRCFNWISAGRFNEKVWVRKKGDTNWIGFDSYDTVTADVANTASNYPYRKGYTKETTNAAYAKITSRFPGNNFLFTSHKAVLVFQDVPSGSETWEYVVGRANKNGMPDPAHTNLDDIHTFTLYSRDYEGRVYQITDQQGFHWIEYQVWAAAAEFINDRINEECAGKKVFPILINTGDMTQSGCRINEWLDYYNGGKCLFNHLEQINCVGNNDLCSIDTTVLGTGDDIDKSNSEFFHYFYCFDLPYDDSMVVKAHNGVPARYVPSTYYIRTTNMFYLICNSEFTVDTCKEWFKLISKKNGKTVNIYTGITIEKDGIYDTDIVDTAENTISFTPIYNTLYDWLTNQVGDRKVVVACHEMPFTVITNESLSNTNAATIACTRNFPLNKASSLGSHMNQLHKDENRGIYWMSRLLEQFGCKLVIGGHKHTYALSFPIREKYQWADTTAETPVFIDSLSQKKTLSSTLYDESMILGSDGIKTLAHYDVSWDMPINDSVRTDYWFANALTEKNTFSTTKAPYIPQDLYNIYNPGKTPEASLFRCCTPTESGDDTYIRSTDENGNVKLIAGEQKYDGFITYSMAQATGYKLKSNKELPSTNQLFSQIIPKTTHGASSDSPSDDQLYPTYAVIDVNFNASNKVDKLNIDMIRVQGISKSKDTFTQINYGTGTLTPGYLSAAANPANIYGKWVTATKNASGIFEKPANTIYKVIKY